MNLSKEQLNEYYTWVYVNDVREYTLVSMPLRSLSQPWDMSSLGFTAIGIVSNTTEIKFLGLHGDPITVTGIEAINKFINQSKPYARKVIEINASSLWDTVDELYEGDIMKFGFKKKKKEQVSIYDPHHTIEKIGGTTLEDILDKIQNYECKNDSARLFPPYYAAIYKNIKGEYHVRITKEEDLTSLPETLSPGYSFIGIASEQTTMGFDYPNPTEPGMVIQKSMCIGNSAIIKELCEGYKKEIVIDSLNQGTLWTIINDLIDFIERHKKYKEIADSNAAKYLEACRERDEMSTDLEEKIDNLKSEAKASDAINPSYYGPKGMQPDDYSRAHNMSNMLHQTLKYMTRAGKKNPDKHIEDLDKALNCLRKEREFVLKEQEKGEKE